MKTHVSILLSISLVFLATVLGGIASAEVITISGAVKSIDIVTNSAVIATFDGPEVTVFVEDELTINKFRDRRIKEDSEVKVKYIIRDGKNVATYFKKILGCL